MRPLNQPAAWMNNPGEPEDSAFAADTPSCVAQRHGLPAWDVGVEIMNRGGANKLKDLDGLDPVYCGVPPYHLSLTRRFL